MTRPGAIVGILGGMGPAAGADFVRLFVEACVEHLHHEGRAVTDQAFPEHWLVQPPIPDRSRALESGEPEHSPLEAMLQAVERLGTVGARHVAIACNTAHAWHEQLQARSPGIEVLHIAREVARELSARGVRRVGLLATRGTYGCGIYEEALAEAALDCHLPQEPEREALMRGIYQGVKAGNLPLAQRIFEDVAAALVQRHDLDVLVLGCTEIPLALKRVEEARHVQLVDAAQVLAAALVRRVMPGVNAEPARSGPADPGARPV